MTTRYRGNSGRRYTPTAMVGLDFAAVRVIVHGGGMTYLHSVTFELRAAHAMTFGVALIEAAALSRAGLTEATAGEPATAFTSRRYSAAPATRGRVALVVFDAESTRVLPSLGDTMTADDATAYGLALIQAAGEARAALTRVAVEASA